MPARMKLSSIYATLPHAEKKVADFIMSNPDEAAHMVINEIAEHAGVSVPSVTRLARKLGYSGFLDFRVSLASGSSSIRTEAAQPLADDDPDSLVLQKLMVGHMASIESTLKVLDVNRLSELASKMFDFRRVLWFAVGSCANLASNVSESFCRMGIDSFIISDRSIMRTYAERVTEDDLVVCLTRTGCTQCTLGALETAKKRGATTALITNLINSEGEQFADFFLCTSREDDLYRICGYETGTAMCALLESFMILVGKRRMQDCKLDFGGAMNLYVKQ